MTTIGKPLPAPAPAPAVPASQPLKVLFFSHDGKLGDAVVNTAFVAALKGWAPQCEIHVTTAGVTTAFLEADERITRVWPLPRRNWIAIVRLGLALRRERICHIVTWLRARSEKNRCLLWLAAPTQVVDLRDFNAGPTRPRIEACGAASARIGMPARPLAYDVRYPGRAFILVNLFAADRERNIDNETGAHLLRKLRVAMPGAVLGVLYSAASFESAGAVVHEAGTGDLVNCDGDLVRLFSVCRQADVVISTDTSVVHIASALNTPVVGIYQNDGVKPVQWGPRGAATAIVLSASAQDVQSFDVDDVVRQALALQRRVRQA